MHVVTGAAGFIGSTLAHELAGEGVPLLLCDFPPNELKAQNLVGLSPVQFVHPDELIAAMDARAGEIEVVWHMGANSDTTERDWGLLERVNIGASQALWNWCARHRVPYYYASSAATYGDGAQGFSDLTPPEELRPLNLYGKSKNDFDAWVLSQVRTGVAAPPHWAGFKFFNVYGAREQHKGRMASIIWKAKSDMELYGRVRLFRSNDSAIADGEQRRDFVWVGDVLAQMRWVASEQPESAIYNAGTGAASTFLEMIEAFFAAQGAAPNIEFVNMPEGLVKQYQNYTCADMARIRREGYVLQPTRPSDGVIGSLSVKSKEPPSPSEGSTLA